LFWHIRFRKTEVPATRDSLGPENKLIMAPDYLRGTVSDNCRRLSIGAKNLLTGGIKESDVGGLTHRIAVPGKSGNYRGGRQPGQRIKNFAAR